MGVVGSMKKFWINYLGQSMSPLLQDDDQILIESINPDQLNYGDVVLFLDQQSRELTLHRLIEFPLQTKGDFSLAYEANANEALLGRAIGFERKDYFRKFPASHSRFTKVFLLLSKLRMQGRTSRRIALGMLFILTKIFQFYSDKTKLNYNKEQFLADL